MGQCLPTVNEDTPLSAITPLLQHENAVIVMKAGRPQGIITKADLLKVVHR